MRDILIIGIVAIASLMALRRPWIGIMLWTWLSIMNPHRYSWGAAYDAPLAAMAAASTFAGLLMTKERQSPFQGLPTVFLGLLAVWITLSWLFGVDVSGDYAQWTRVMKIYLMTLVAIVLLRSKHQITAYAWVTALSLALLGAKGGVFTILSGGSHRVWGPEGSYIGGNNELALALITIIPLLRFLQMQVSSRWARLVMGSLIFLCAASAIGSYSRGALLAIASMGWLFWWRSERSGKGVIGIGIIIVLAALPLMPEAWWARMGTIETYETDGSAIGRFNGWIVATEVAKHNFFGGGMSFQHREFFSLYGFYNTNTIAAHSIYFQILGNHGFVGLFLYLAIWITTYRWAGWLRKNAGKIPEATWAAELGGMAQVSLIGFAVGGAFLSLAYFDLPYNIMVMVVLARKWVETRAWERELQVPFLEYAGIWRRKSRPRAVVAQPAERSSG